MPVRASTMASARTPAINLMELVASLLVGMGKSMASEGEDRDAELVGFSDGVVLGGRIDEDHGLGQFVHFFDTAEVLGELGEFFLEKRDFLLGETFPGAISLLGLEFTKPLDAGGDGAEVGEGAT